MFYANNVTVSSLDSFMFTNKWRHGWLAKELVRCAYTVVTMKILIRLLSACNGACVYTHNTKHTCICSCAYSVPTSDVTMNGLIVKAVTLGEIFNIEAVNCDIATRKREWEPGVKWKQNSRLRWWRTTSLCMCCFASRGIQHWKKHRCRRDRFVSFKLWCLW